MKDVFPWCCDTDQCDCVGGGGGEVLHGVQEGVPGGAGGQVLGQT